MSATVQQRSSGRFDFDSARRSTIGKKTGAWDVKGSGVRLMGRCWLIIGAISEEFELALLISLRFLSSTKRDGRLAVGATILPARRRGFSPGYPTIVRPSIAPDVPTPIACLAC